MYHLSEDASWSGLVTDALILGAEPQCRAALPWPGSSLCSVLSSLSHWEVIDPHRRGHERVKSSTRSLGLAHAGPVMCCSFTITALMATMAHRP